MNKDYSKGLEFESHEDGTCCLIGPGKCRSKNIKIPPVSPDGEAVTEIFGQAFYNCKIRVVTIPESVTTIGCHVFYGCNSLKSITVAEGNPVYHSAGNCIIETASKTLIAGCGASVIPTDGSVTSIDDYAFDGCGSIINITIPESVTSIGYKAFYDCSSLISVTIGNGVTRIDGSAFWGCSSLINVTIGSGVTIIGSWDFCDCSSITSITIPDNVTRIAGRAFSDCGALINVTIGRGVTNIGECAFYECCSLASITYAGTKAQWRAIRKDDYWDEETGFYTIRCTDGEITK